MTTGPLVRHGAGQQIREIEHRMTRSDTVMGEWGVARWGSRDPADDQRGNIDEAFIRRVPAAVPVPAPDSDQRGEIWRRAIPPQPEIADEIDGQDGARRFELTGARIVDVTPHLCRGGDPPGVRRGGNGRVCGRG